MDEAQRQADRWNKRHAGKPAGKLGKDGFNWVTLTHEGQRIRMRCDRVIWALQTGAYPAGEIIHVNGNNADDRWDNLRDSGATQ